MCPLRSFFVLIATLSAIFAQDTFHTFQWDVWDVDEAIGKNKYPFCASCIIEDVHPEATRAGEECSEYNVTKVIRVFGVPIYKHRDVPEHLHVYTAAVLAKYLDADEDGIADDERIVQHLQCGRPLNEAECHTTRLDMCEPSVADKVDWMCGVFLVISREVVNDPEHPEGGKYRFYNEAWGPATLLFAYDGSNEHGELVGYQGASLEELRQAYLNNEPSPFQVYILEELHHTWTMGVKRAYPDVFRDWLRPGEAAFEDVPDTIDSDYMRAVYQPWGTCLPATGACQQSNTCANWDCSNEECTFLDGSCEYSYLYGGCPGYCSDEVWWQAFAIIKGLRFAGCEDVVRHGGFADCTLEDMKTNPQVKLIYDLVTGAASSATTYGYVAPSVIPDGVYRATSMKIPPRATPSPTAPTQAPVDDGIRDDHGDDNGDDHDGDISSGDDDYYESCPPSKGNVEYVMLQIGSEGCSPGTEIFFWKECKCALEALGLTEIVVWAHYPGAQDANMPRFCSVDTAKASGHHMYYNIALTGRGNADLAPVCKIRTKTAPKPAGTKRKRKNKSTKPQTSAGTKRKRKNKSRKAAMPAGTKRKRKSKSSKRGAKRTKKVKPRNRRKGGR